MLINIYIYIYIHIYVYIFRHIFTHMYMPTTLLLRLLRLLCNEASEGPAVRRCHPSIRKCIFGENVLLHKFDTAGMIILAKSPCMAGC